MMNLNGLNKNHRFRTLALCTLFSALLCASCSADIRGVFKGSGGGADGGSLELEMKITFAQGLLKLAGRQADAPVINAEALNRSLLSVPDIEDASFFNSGGDAVSGKLVINNINDFLSGEDFITIKPAGTVRIELDRQNSPQIIPKLSPELADYLSAFFAPAESGENLNSAEYLQLVKEVYGERVSLEIASSFINANFVFEKNVRSASCPQGEVHWSGNKVSVRIPLLSLLVLESPFVLNIEL